MAKRRDPRAKSRAISMDDEIHEKVLAHAKKKRLSFSALIRIYAEHCLACPRFKKNFDGL